MRLFVEASQPKQEVRVLDPKDATIKNLSNGDKISFSYLLLSINAESTSAHPTKKEDCLSSPFF